MPVSITDAYDPTLPFRAQMLRHTRCEGTGHPFPDPHGKVLCPCCSAEIKPLPSVARA